MPKALGGRAGSAARSTLRFEYASDSQDRELGRGLVLLEVHYGELAVEPRTDSLVVGVPLEALAEHAIERWIVGGPVHREREHGFELALCGDVLAGSATAEGEDVEGDTRVLYERLLALTGERGFHLLRVWNVVPALHARTADLDRYMGFCRGRAEAFEAAWGPRFAERLCAFSAVGSERGPQTLYFLASRTEGTPRENPRQVPAWCYPARYGPRSPSFARALRAPASLGGMLFVSGTASIVGHESRHADDVRAQTLETLHNLRALLDGEDDDGGGIGGGRFGPAKIYLARSNDHTEVMPMIVDALAPDTPVLYLRADLCRPELLVEIEGVGHPADERTRGSTNAR